MRVMASNFFVFLLVSSSSAPGGETQLRRTTSFPAAPSISYPPGACSLQRGSRKPTLPDEIRMLSTTWGACSGSCFLPLLLWRELVPLGGIQPPFLQTPGEVQGPTANCLHDCE